jgi:Protein kinase G tetratricopeptide repeat
MECKEKGCEGTVVNGRCNVCDTSPSQNKPKVRETEIQTPAPAAPDTFEAQAEASTDDLLHKSQKLMAMVPDDYQAWRMQADLFLQAINRLETREIEPDESIKLMHVPLRESALREAAEEALRNCAHFAQTFDERVELIDQANRIRRTTWF